MREVSTGHRARAKGGVVAAIALAVALLGLTACDGESPLPFFNPDDTGADVAVDAGGRDPGVAYDPGRDPGIVPTDPGTDPGVPDDPGTPADPGGPDVFECVDSSTCLLGHICVDHACVPGCLSDRDCANDRFCNPALGENGSCVVCLNESHCGDGEKCVAGACVTTCLVEDDCAGRPATPHCDAITGLCVACTTDGQCAIGSLCVDYACVAGCRSDRDCQEPLKCDRTVGANGTCVPCVVDTDCPEGQACQASACVVDCARIECPAERPVCLPGTGACVQCDDKADCGIGKLCVNNACIAGCESDSDCANPLHCKTGVSGGTCVQCVLDSHCSDGKVCRSNTCSTGGCVKDADCGAGKYCHPLLGSCEALPGDSCSTDADCTGWLGLPGLLDQYCDPLTRECIDGCTSLPLCFDLLGSGRTVCLDGLCYGCGSDADCGGTRCDPFDRFCDRCATNADCAYPGWVCQTSSGSCFECLTTSDCGVGKVCDTANHECVECLSSQDCKNPLKPVCGKSGTCLAPCTDQCVAGKRRCNPNDTTAPISYQDCGDTDDDPCTEWGTAYECGLASTCATQTDGTGKCVCANECTSGDTQCKVGDTGRQYYCAQSNVTGCWYWTSSSCSYGEVCSGGECVCDDECTEGDRACDAQDTGIYYTCAQDFYAYCWYWQTNYCGTGTKCVEGSCK